MMSYDIDSDINWFKDHEDELVKRYDGKTIAIRNGEVLTLQIWRARLIFLWESILYRNVFMGSKSIQFIFTRHGWCRYEVFWSH